MTCRFTELDTLSIFIIYVCKKSGWFTHWFCDHNFNNLKMKATGFQEREFLFRHWFNPGLIEVQNFHPIFSLLVIHFIFQVQNKAAWAIFHIRVWELPFRVDFQPFFFWSFKFLFPLAMIIWLQNAHNNWGTVLWIQIKKSFLFPPSMGYLK